MSFLRQIPSLLRRIGAFQGVLVLSAFYVLVGGVVFCIMKLTRHDPLAREVHNGSSWRMRKQGDTSLEAFSSQF